jgi:hypothetical protein
VDLKGDLIRLSEKAYDRLRARLDGLTDDELTWEPAPIAWNVRPGDGETLWDFGLAPVASPVPTIGWRLVHIFDLLTEDRCALLLGLEEAEPNDFVITGTAAAAIAELERGFAMWRRTLERMDESRLGEPTGHPYWSDRLMFAFHIIDEVIHHAAEVALLRDLYAARNIDPLRAAALRGDRAAVEPHVDELRQRHPSLVAEAAAGGHWDGALLLVELGFDVGAPALHHAAGMGRPALVRALLAAGASTTDLDERFNATPRTWAEMTSQRLGGPNAVGADWAAVFEILPGA